MPAVDLKKTTWHLIAINSMTYIHINNKMNYNNKESRQNMVEHSALCAYLYLFIHTNWNSQFRKGQCE